MRHVATNHRRFGPIRKDCIGCGLEIDRSSLSSVLTRSRARAAIAEHASCKVRISEPPHAHHPHYWQHRTPLTSLGCPSAALHSVASAVIRPQRPTASDGVPLEPILVAFADPPSTSQTLSMSSDTAKKALALSQPDGAQKLDIIIKGSAIKPGQYIPRAGEFP